MQATKTRSDSIKTLFPEIINYLLKLQDQLCRKFTEFEQTHEITQVTKNLAAHSPTQFQEDIWERSEGGGGITKILRHGKVFEQVGVNFSHVFGGALPPSASQARPELKDYSFQAIGVSVVAHPWNPYLPTTHMNVRFFVAEKPGHPPIWWFGGGFDLTPYYPFEEDCIHWHKTAKQACDPFGKDVYEKFKNWADEYFYLKHRAEPRGMGGIFFDDLNEWPIERCFEFMQSVGNHFSLAYFPIAQKRSHTPYTERERNFQLYRRGRYVEFNLLYDRGTLFGLHSGGRTESILMSLPPAVAWEYNWTPISPDAPEARLTRDFLKVRDWV